MVAVEQVHEGLAPGLAHPARVDARQVQHLAPHFFDAIPVSAQAQSPLNVIKGTVGEETGEIVAANDPMAKRETLDLVRAYYSIPDPQIRRRVYELAKALGGGKDKGG